MILEYQNECSFYNYTQYIFEFWLFINAVIGLNFSLLYELLWGSVLQQGRREEIHWQDFQS